MSRPLFWKEVCEWILLYETDVSAKNDHIVGGYHEGFSFVVCLFYLLPPMLAKPMVQCTFFPPVYSVSYTHLTLPTRRTV